MNHEITLQTAIAMTTRYRDDMPADYPICETFEVSAINRLLATAGAVSLRIYYGLKEAGTMHAILVAVDSNGNDLLPMSQNSFATNEQDPVILEDSFRCPPTCPPDSPLNT